VEVRFVQNLTDKDHAWTIHVTANKNRDGGLIPTHANTKEAEISETKILDATELEYKPKKGPNAGKTVQYKQFAAIHEFGHLLGLWHPGDYVDDQLWLEAGKRGAYTIDRFSAMGEGNDMRGWYFAAWATFLDETEQKSGPWQIRAHQWHPTFDMNFNRYQNVPADFGVRDLLPFEGKK
jgi:hypothetical protein